MVKKRKSDIMLEILKEKGMTKTDWRKECVKKGMSDKTFYYHLPRLQSKGKIKYVHKERIWVLLEPRDGADPKEVKLYIDCMNCQDEKIRKLGSREFVRLCRDNVVIHDPFIKIFFKNSLKESSFDDIHGELLDAFRFVIARLLSDENYEMLESMLSDNNDAIKVFVESGSLKLKRRAISILALTKDKEVLDLVYKIIKESTDEEYRSLKEDMWEIFQSFSGDYRIEIKRKLYEIAISKDFSESITDRAIDLLSRFSPDYKAVLS